MWCGVNTKLIQRQEHSRAVSVCIDSALQECMATEAGMWDRCVLSAPRSLEADQSAIVTSRVNVVGSANCHAHCIHARGMRGACQPQGYPHADAVTCAVDVCAILYLLQMESIQDGSARGMDCAYVVRCVLRIQPLQLAATNTQEVDKYTHATILMFFA